MKKNRNISPYLFPVSWHPNLIHWFTSICRWTLLIFRQLWLGQTCFTSIISFVTITSVIYSRVLWRSLWPRVVWYKLWEGVWRFKNWMLILVLLCENERQRWDASPYIKACSEAQRFYVYRDASRLWRSFSHNRTKINIQLLFSLWRSNCNVAK